MFVLDMFTSRVQAELAEARRQTQQAKAQSDQFQAQLVALHERSLRYAHVYSPTSTNSRPYFRGIF